VIVNKVNPLSPISYAPRDLVKPSKYNPLGRYVRKTVASQLILMGNAMKKETKRSLIIQSGYRSFGSQTKIHNAEVKLLGLIKGERLAARPGYSEHQTGLAVDLGAVGVKTLNKSFANTVAGKWLAANAYRFGFILRYPQDQTSITGYQFEPWHFRFVGVTVATNMHNQSVLTLEQYYHYPSAPEYLN
jgi:D-alanyl-D-alanine carboxypeptidase